MDGENRMLQSELNLIRSEQIDVEGPYNALWKSKGFTDKPGNKTRDYS